MYTLFDHPEEATEDGALMEQRLQPVAIGGKCDAPKTAHTSENRCRGLRPAA